MDGASLWLDAQPSPVPEDDRKVSGIFGVSKAVRVSMFRKRQGVRPPLPLDVIAKLFAIDDFVPLEID